MQKEEHAFWKIADFLRAASLDTRKTITDRFQLPKTDWAPPIAILERLASQLTAKDAPAISMGDIQVTAEYLRTEPGPRRRAYDLLFWATEQLNKEALPELTKVASSIIQVWSFLLEAAKRRGDQESINALSFEIAALSKLVLKRGSSEIEMKPEEFNPNSLSSEELIDLFAKLAEVRITSALNLLDATDAQANETQFRQVRRILLSRLSKSE